MADNLPSETSTFPVQGGDLDVALAPASTRRRHDDASRDDAERDDGHGDHATETTTGTTATETTTTETVPTKTTPTTPEADDEAAAAAERKRKRAARIKRERAEAKAKAKKRQAAATAAGKGVTVRVDASVRPTFLCVDNGNGTTMFSGTLTGKKVFRAKRVRMNIGLASTRITVNGNPVRIDGSPAGLDITRKGGAGPCPRPAPLRLEEALLAVCGRLEAEVRVGA